MPSPVGHVLGGLAAGTLVRRAGWRAMLVFAAAGALPDVDFLLPLQHRGPSHSIGAAAMAFGVSLAVLSFLPGRIDRLRVAVAVGLAYLSHTLLDWLSQDSWEPRGLMALWPFSSAYYISDIDVFDAVTRRYWEADFWSRNLRAVAREIVILGPLVLVIVLFRRRSERQRGVSRGARLNQR